MKRHRGGLRVEKAADPIGAIPEGKEGYGRGARVFAHHEGGVRGSQETTSGERGGGERRGGGPGPS